MKINVKNVDFKVGFSYKVFNEEGEMLGFLRAKKPGLSRAELGPGKLVKTVCLLEELGTGLLYADSAMQSKLDPFNKKVGRKLAFERALNKIPGISKEDKVAAWEQFLSKVKV